MNPNDFPASPRDPMEAAGELQQRVSEQLQALREMKLGDLIDNGMSWVRQNPMAGITVAAMVGFAVGRLFRR